MIMRMCWNFLNLKSAINPITITKKIKKSLFNKKKSDPDTPFSKATY